MLAKSLSGRRCLWKFWERCILKQSSKDEWFSILDHLLGLFAAPPPLLCVHLLYLCIIFILIYLFTYEYDSHYCHWFYFVIKMNKWINPCHLHAFNSILILFVHVHCFVCFFEFFLSFSSGFYLYCAYAFFFISLILCIYKYILFLYS